MRSNSPAMRFSPGRQRLPRMRPSTLAFMWQITYGFMFAFPVASAGRSLDLLRKSGEFPYER